MNSTCPWLPSLPCHVSFHSLTSLSWQHFNEFHPRILILDFASREQDSSTSPCSVVTWNVAVGSLSFVWLTDLISTDAFPMIKSLTLPLEITSFVPSSKGAHPYLTLSFLKSQNLLGIQTPNDSFFPGVLLKCCICLVLLIAACLSIRAKATYCLQL